MGAAEPTTVLTLRVPADLDPIAKAVLGVTLAEIQQALPRR